MAVTNIDITENMVRNGQDLFGSIYMVNKLFQGDISWEKTSEEDQQKILYDLWVNTSDRAKAVWIMTAERYLMGHSIGRMVYESDA